MKSNKCPLKTDHVQKNDELFEPTITFQGNMLIFKGGILKNVALDIYIYMELFSNKNLPSKLLLKINFWSSCPCNIKGFLTKNSVEKHQGKTKTRHAKKLVESVPQPTRAAPCLARKFYLKFP